MGIFVLNCIQLERKIKLLWDFRGPDALETAKHHTIHLKEFAAIENLPFHEYEGKRLFGIDLQFVTEFDELVFACCSKIQCIKLYENQYIRDDVFENVNFE